MFEKKRYVALPLVTLAISLNAVPALAELPQFMTNAEGDKHQSAVFQPSQRELLGSNNPRDAYKNTPLEESPNYLLFEADESFKKGNVDASYDCYWRAFMNDKFGGYKPNQAAQRARERISSKYFNQALQKHAGKNYHGAIADYESALKWSQHDPAVHWYLGNAYKSIGNKQKAQSEFEAEKRPIAAVVPNMNGPATQQYGDFLDQDGKPLRNII